MSKFSHGEVFGYDNVATKLQRSHYGPGLGSSR
jgi:hypothetical protein